jgi:16S rRNA (guanine966-N2)-methyltransferase
MRISGGTHRSRVLASPRGTSTRPTSDRVREALFSILEARGVVRGARVLDLYAGTGALGLEALSRGAEQATFVESDRRALEALARNVDALRERDRSRIVPHSVWRAFPLLGDHRASLVLCDPPYAEVADAESVAKLLAALVERQVTDEGATIVLEHASRHAEAVTAPPELPLEQADQRHYGDTTLSFFRVYTRPLA